MKVMKNLIAFLILTVSSNFLMADIEPTLSTKYIYAYSGLKLRATPGSDGQVLKVIPYGDKVTILENSEKEDLIEWMSGHWVLVSHDGTEGYLFEGFISDMPIPEYKFEMTQNDLDLTYPLLAWAEYHFDETRTSDTLLTDNLDRITQYLENGIIVSRRDNPYDFKVTMELPETKLEEAYNLVKSMLLTEAERYTFENKSIFIDNLDGDIHRIKVNLEKPLEIRTLANGNTKIIVTAFHTGCDVF